ncbi:inositol 2-dehydrogenase [Pantoea sp. RIT-PI-b]|uniref:Gfo/Idh/MocA family protein n=1 Tax=Pantoea sp. RIT-PI-b TaxID=1681195 RepID=UPI0006761228|nr:Gfo/Idh/MocA family oxidoreductase [Pantoea sp. RIT-PI-b]KNC05963.1 inositol 2-dehydrogenase [Pantoea sp. RIT-PI-b]
MTLNIGVIGTGAIGREHIRRCSQVLQHSRVVALNDINRANCEQIIKDLAIQAEIYDNAHDLINAPEVQAILVTSWGPTHEEFVLAAINAGKAVFCEKPLAVTAQGCMNIVEAEMAAGKQLVQVGFMRPYDSGYRALKAVIDSGEIGEPLMLHCAHRNPEVGDSYTTDMAITDTLIHELDVLRWLLKDDYVSAQVIYPRTTRKASAHLKDPQIVLLETAKGVRIDVEIFVNCAYGYDIQCEVVGESGIARLPEPMSVQTRSAAKLSTRILTDWKKRFIDAYDVELQDFINNVLSGEMTGPSAWDGYAAAVAADACVAAQTSGDIVPVTMPAKPAFYY